MSRSPDEPMTRSALDRYFSISLYLLVVTGFVTLASTGRLDLPALLVVSAALLYRGYLLVRGRSVQLPERWASYATLAYVVFYLCDLFLLSGSFISASVHLVLFVMVVKIFSVQRDRDYVYLTIISFLSVLAAALLTVDAVFLAAFCVFVILAASTFISMEMRRSAARASAQPRDSQRQSQRLARSLSTTAVALALGTAVGAALIFFIMPRFSTGYLSAYAPHNALMSGFSDSVKLGEIGQIQQTDTVVMHIQIDGDTRGEHDLKWRGVALGAFDGTRWSNPQRQATALSDANGNYDLSTTRAAALASLPSSRVRYRVLMEPIGASVFFLTPRPRSLSGNYHPITVDEGGAVYNGDREHAIGSYRAVSEIGQPTPDQLRRATAELPHQVAFQYLQLPTLDPRVQQLARDITARAANAYDKATTIELYLQKQYRYTLQLPAAPPRDPVAYFLFERKAGHCEYFASSMALMLRTVGIPARVVNGFRAGEFNTVTGSYIIRGRDAHSWVEAYFPGYGWIAFDPTPAGATTSPGTWSRRVGLYLDALSEFWREWVINYDFAHQLSLSNDLILRGRRSFDVSKLWLHRRYAALLERARQAQVRAEQSPGRLGAWALGTTVLLVVLLNLGGLLRALRVQRAARNPARAPQAAASIWYSRMLRRLSRRGWRKLPEQTPQEFARTIGDPQVRTPVQSFIDHYERARFGASSQDAQALPEIYEEISKS